MIPVLLDTGVIVALLDRSERHHQRVVELVSSLQAPLVTCEAVVAESCYLLRKLHGAPAAILRNVDRGIFQLPYRLVESAQRLVRFLDKYAEVPIALADARLIDMATELGTGRILTLDSDFRIYRWAKNRRFELMIEL